MAKKPKIVNKVQEDNELGSRKTLIEELFYDFNKNRQDIYVTNFFRGIFFGFGSVLGGTIVIGLLIWILSMLGNFIPPLGEFFDGISNLLSTPRK